MLEVPLYVRRGSILAVGPPLQHTHEKVADPLEIRVYDGADGTFTLYEDDGVSSPSEGAAATIKFTWDESTSTLSVSAYRGKGFPGRLEKRWLNLVRVRSAHGVGYVQTNTPDKAIAYEGSALTVTLPKA